jgi:hypothetical protein
MLKENTSSKPSNTRLIANLRQKRHQTKNNIFSLIACNITLIMLECKEDGEINEKI